MCPDLGGSNPPCRGLEAPQSALDKVSRQMAPIVNHDTCAPPTFISMSRAAFGLYKAPTETVTILRGARDGPPSRLKRRQADSAFYSGISVATRHAANDFL